MGALQCQYHAIDIGLLFINFTCCMHRRCHATFLSYLDAGPFTWFVYCW